MNSFQALRRLSQLVNSWSTNKAATHAYDEDHKANERAELAELLEVAIPHATFDRELELSATNT